MSTEQNKALVRRFYEEVWNKGNYSLADELVDDDGSRYDHETTGPNSAEIQKQAAAGFRRLFPDSQMVIEMMVAEDEWVAARWRIHGTHQGSGKVIATPPEIAAPGTAKEEARCPHRLRLTRFQQASLGRVAVERLHVKLHQCQIRG